MDQSQHILQLLERYTANTCTEAEISALFSYLDSGKYDRLLDKHISGKLDAAHVAGAGLEARRGDAIVRKIFSVPAANEAIIKRIVLKQRAKRIAGIAGMVVLATGITFITLQQQSGEQLKQPVTVAWQPNSKHYTNTTGKAVLLPLEDGSRVTLQPGATLTYPVAFMGSRREVVLEGDAFFDIAGTPDKPFMVYHGHLVTRVLGTSFYIHYNNHLQEAAVEVTTGKVEVSENSGLHKTVHKSNGVIITPNQKMVYAENNRTFSISLVDNPMPVSQKELQTAALCYNFENTPIDTIIRTFERGYGIEIELENGRLSNCLFSGDVSGYLLYDKLDIISRAIGGSYEIKGTKILIKGPGCEAATK